MGRRLKLFTLIFRKNIESTVSGAIPDFITEVER